MGKEEEMACCPDGRPGMIVVAALILALGLMGGGYLLAQGDYAPKVNVTGGPAYPNVYVSSTPPDHAISVSGTVSQKVTPDLLQMQIRVQTEAQNAQKSQTDNAAVMADLKSKLKDEGVAEEDIQTASFSVDPVYESNYVCGTSGYSCHYDYNLTGYRTTHTLSVKLSDLTKGGEVIDAAMSAGVNQTFVDYVQFTLKDETRRSLEKSLLQNASAAAKGRAESIATGLGVSLGNVLSASESVYYPTYYRNYYAMEAMASSAPKTDLSPGQVDVSATVSASFEVQ